MLNRSASLAMSTSVLKALPGKLDIKRHSPSILYIRPKDSCLTSKKTKCALKRACVLMMLNKEINDKSKLIR